MRIRTKRVKKEIISVSVIHVTCFSHGRSWKLWWAGDVWQALLADLKVFVRDIGGHKTIGNVWIFSRMHQMIVLWEENLTPQNSDFSNPQFVATPYDNYFNPNWCQFNKTSASVIYKCGYYFCPVSKTMAKLVIFN